MYSPWSWTSMQGRNNVFTEDDGKEGRAMYLALPFLQVAAQVQAYQEAMKRPEVQQQMAAMQVGTRWIVHAHPPLN
jgi:hypothetical protein